MAEFQRLSQLDSGVLRANRIRPCLGAGVAAVAAGSCADRTLQEFLEERLRSRGLRCFAVGPEHRCSTRVGWRSGGGEFRRERILTASNVQPVFDGVEPPFAGYRRTEQALARYIELARTDDGEKLP